MSKRKLLVIDDDSLQQVILAKPFPYNPVFFVSGHDFLAQLNQMEEPIGVFLDVHLGAHDNGLDLIPKIKGAWPYSPIIVVSSDQDSELVSLALAAGASDFISKPVHANEAYARMQVRIKELYARKQTEIIFCGDCEINIRQRTISNGDRIRYFSPIELSLMLSLVQFEGVVVKREELKKECWGQVSVTDNAMNRKLHELRQIISDISSRIEIQTVYSQGFILNINKDMA